VVSQTEIEFVNNNLNIFRTTDDALVVRHILNFLFTNSISVFETT
jgi:hypothetical protein